MTEIGGMPTNCASFRGGWGQRSCPMGAMAVHSVIEHQPSDWEADILPQNYCSPRWSLTVSMFRFFWSTKKFDVDLLIRKIFQNNFGPCKHFTVNEQNVSAKFSGWSSAVLNRDPLLSIRVGLTSISSHSLINFNVINLQYGW